MASFLFLTSVMLIIGISYHKGAAQRMFLTSNNTTPCYNNTVDLICYYPDVMERVNEQLRYSVTIPSWRENGKVIFPDEDVFSQKPINQTASRLIVRIDPAIFTGDPVNFTCYLLLTSGGEDSASTVVDPQDTAAPPTFTDPLVNGTSVTVSWDHTDKGPCFNHLTFSYNITWYPVVGGVPQKEEGQSSVTGPGATVYIITNLMNDTDYRVELVGFTSIHPPVFSIVATVGFTTKVTPTDGKPGGAGVDNTTAVAVAVPVGIVSIILAVSVALCLTVCYRRRRGLSVCYRRRRGLSVWYIRRRDKHTVSTGLQKSKKEVAGASVPVGSREAMSITSFSVVETATAGHQEQCGTELPSDQWRSHYADLDKKWLDEVRYNHIDNELFNVPYAVVDRAAMAPRAPQLAVVKETPADSVARVVQLIDSFIDGTYKEDPILAFTPAKAQALEEECLKLEDSELILSTMKISQPSDLPVLSCGWYAEETSADSADALSVTNCKPDNAPQEEHTTPLDEDAAPEGEHATPQEEQATPLEEDTTQQEPGPSCDEEHYKLEVPKSQLYLTQECFAYVSHCTDEFEIFSLGVLMLQVATLNLPTLHLGGSGTQEKDQCTADLIGFASKDDLEPFDFAPLCIYHVEEPGTRESSLNEPSTSRLQTAAEEPKGSEIVVGCIKGY